MDQKEQSRLLVSTFTVASTLTVYFTDVSISVSSDSVWALVIGILLVALTISAIFSFLYILLKGYELRYEKKDKPSITPPHHLIHSLACLVLPELPAVCEAAGYKTSCQAYTLKGDVFCQRGHITIHR